MLSAALRMAGRSSVSCSALQRKAGAAADIAAQPPSDVQDGHTDGPDPGFVFLVGDGVPAGPNVLDLGAELFAVGDGVGSNAGQFHRVDQPDEPDGLLGGCEGDKHLAHRGAGQRAVTATFADHPDLLRTGDVMHVQLPVTVQHRHQHRLTGLLGQPFHLRQHRPGKPTGTGDLLAEREDPQPEVVAPVGVRQRREPAADQTGQQPVGGAERESRSCGRIPRSPSLITAVIAVPYPSNYSNFHTPLHFHSTEIPTE
jgi:hypothetical protein